MGIKAELHGKISSTGSNLSESMEDLLTSNVFQLLRYIPLEAGLLSILIEAINIDGDSLVFPDGIDSAQVHFWKCFKRSEPDLFIVLKASNQIVANIMIEAKYLSGKSGVALYEGEENDQLYVKGSDQLEKEWADLKEQSISMKTPFSLIYLTMDWIIPRMDILESIQAIDDQSSKKNIYWLNWQTMNTVLTGILKDRSFVLSESEKTVIHDIIELLDKKGLKDFNGIDIPTNLGLELFNYFNLSFYEHIPPKEFESLKYYEGGSYD